jgi:uncharacterized RDD family membrane protein YckC
VTDDPNAPRPDRDVNAPRPDRDPDAPQPGGGTLLPPAPGGPPPAAPPTPTPPGPGTPPAPGGVDPSVSAQRSYWGPPPDVSRPRGPAPGYEYAGFWIRLVAFLIDLVPLLIVSFIVLAPLIGSLADSFRDLPPAPRGADLESPEYQAWQALVMQRTTNLTAQFTPISGLLQLFSAVYYVGFWTWRGQTPGMMLFGLRVARETDGSPPGLARSILRYVGYFISQLVLFIGFIWVAFDSRKQGWHDKIAGTVVVRRAG